VQTNVDATKLDDYSNLHSYAPPFDNESQDHSRAEPSSESDRERTPQAQQVLYDTIIFCFPRGSSVSGVRSENDDLLSGFFRSGAKVLSPTG